MKTVAIFLTVVGVACAQMGQHHGAQHHAAQPTFAAQPTQHQAAAGAPGAAGAGMGAGGGLLNLLPQPKNYGPKVYGAGHLNQFALPPNPFAIQRAVAIANMRPNVLVRLDLDGELTLTNQYGQEVEAIDAFGREIEIE